MMGFKIIIEIDGEVLKVEKPGAITYEGNWVGNFQACDHVL